MYVCVCIRDVLAFEWKLGNVLHWGRGYAFVPTENKKLWLSSKLIEIKFDWGGLMKILPIDIKKKPRKTTGQMTYMLIPLLWEQL